MNVAILIVAYRNADDVVACLRALTRSTYRDFTVHICENGGDDAFRALSEACKTVDLPVRLVQAPDNLGFAGGNNLLIETASGWDAVWILNPDTEADPGALAALVTTLQQPGYGIIGARLANPLTRKIQLYGGRWRKWRGDGYNIGLGAPVDAVPDIRQIERTMTYINGASMLVSREFIEKIGPMPEDYFLYCEEVEWCLRRRDFKLGYAHDALIWHKHGSTIGSHLDRRQKSPLSTYLTVRNSLILTRKCFPLIYPVTALIALGLLIRYPLSGAWRNFFTALRGWMHGLLGRTGRPTALDLGMPYGA